MEPPHISTIFLQMKRPNPIHQFSFTAEYATLKDGNEGFGDLHVNYRPLLKDKNDWALIIPRLTLILPTGDAKHGLGRGGLGGQFNLAVTKRLSKRFTTHWNAGYTYTHNAKSYCVVIIGEEPSLEVSRDLHGTNLGISGIYSINDCFHLMTEYVSNTESDRGQTSKTSIINPGFRFALQAGNVQIVPGIGIPFYDIDENWKHSGAFFYLSVEPDYTKN